MEKQTKAAAEAMVPTRVGRIFYAKTGLGPVPAFGPQRLVDLHT